MTDQLSTLILSTGYTARIFERENRYRNVIGAARGHINDTYKFTALYLTFPEMALEYIRDNYNGLSSDICQAK